MRLLIYYYIYISISSDLKNNFGSLDITKYLVSANGNYLAKEELDIDGKYFSTTGTLLNSANFRSGYIRYPKAGTYKLFHPKTAFGTAYLRVPLFKGDKTLYRSIQCTSDDEKIVVFTLTEDDAKNAPYIGVSGYKTDQYPMLLLDKEYPSDYTYSSPKYDFSDLNGMRFMGKCPDDLNNAVDSGWYCMVSDTCANVPDGYINIRAGCLIVMRNAMNTSYSIQLLFDSHAPSKSHIWYRYIYTTMALPQLNGHFYLQEKKLTN